MKKKPQPHLRQVRNASPEALDRISGKDFLHGVFSLACGVFDFVEEIKKGRDPAVAAKKALRKTKKRREAILRAELDTEEHVAEVVSEEEGQDEFDPFRRNVG